MSRNHFRDTSREFGVGLPEFRNTPGFRAAGDRDTNINQRPAARQVYYNHDPAVFAEDAEFSSVESPTREGGRSGYLDAAMFQGERSRAGGVEFRPASRIGPVAQSQPVPPYQEPFFPPGRRQAPTAASQWSQQLREPTRPFNRLAALDMSSPPSVVPAAVDESVFTTDSGTASMMGQPSFFGI
ncbi:hypothetical protein ABW21_db0205386 [Orbilia brochopaga]|nr:hypothetical protein ABW21_db0205386 [Drechslerella brochopaga]